MNEQNIADAFKSIGFDSEGEDLVRTAETLVDFERVHGKPERATDTGRMWERKSNRGYMENLYVVDCGDYRLAWCSNDATFRRQ